MPSMAFPHAEECPQGASRSTRDRGAVLHANSFTGSKAGIKRSQGPAANPLDPASAGRDDTTLRGLGSFRGTLRYRFSIFLFAIAADDEAPIYPILGGVGTVGLIGRRRRIIFANVLIRP